MCIYKGDVLNCRNIFLTILFYCCESSIANVDYLSASTKFPVFPVKTDIPMLLLLLFLLFLL